ncbi:hypothetical protein [Geothrix sp. PMB-07]|uniref:hypothetical protein n=1 Tax=Geothrix sp. PMB-07 TaxID=3068640 RepID=UPI002740AA2C|nr:hypothetical protein [Geothrix sp. PMB-07]WLT30297.1 hypothetical protein Q9293_11265 [Geothrix sp. PMB-07]
MNSIFKDIKTGLTGPFRKKRDKFIIIPSESPATLLPTLADEPATNPEVMNMATPTKNPFTYEKGTGKENKAEYKLGRASVPASVMSRIFKEAEDKPDFKQAFILYGKLEKNYVSFLEALDKAGIEYFQALTMMKEIRPVKSQRTGQRAGKAEKTVEAVAKSICKRFKGSPIEMVEAFLTVVNSREFHSEVTDIISAYQKNFGKSALGFTKTSARKGNPNALRALEKFRKNKK